MGVAYHANYLVWCEMGRTDFIRQHVRSYAELEREGVSLAVSDITYRQDASVTERSLKINSCVHGGGTRERETNEDSSP